jgi:hypothetical protein
MMQWAAYGFDGTLLNTSPLLPVDGMGRVGAAVEGGFIFARPLVGGDTEVFFADDDGLMVPGRSVVIPAGEERVRIAGFFQRNGENMAVVLRHDPATLRIFLGTQLLTPAEGLGRRGGFVGIGEGFSLNFVGAAQTQDGHLMLAANYFPLDGGSEEVGRGALYLIEPPQPFDFSTSASIFEPARAESVSTDGEHFTLAWQDGEEMVWQQPVIEEDDVVYRPAPSQLLLVSGLGHSPYVGLDYANSADLQVVMLDSAYAEQERLSVGPLGGADTPPSLTLHQSGGVIASHDGAQTVLLFFGL